MTFYIVLCLLFLFVTVSGAGIMLCVTKKKWGYTEEREKELEKSTFQGRCRQEKGGKV